MIAARTLPTLLALAGFAAAATGPALADDLVAKGEKLFKRCAACHTIEPGKNKVGPSLAGVVGRTAGTAPGYKYSELNHHSGETGLTWTKEHIVDYLKDPTAFLTEWLKEHGKADEAHGRTRMTFKMPKEDDREAVAAYLASLSK